MIASLVARFQRLPRGSRTAILMVFTTMILSSMHSIIRTVVTEGLHPFEVAFFRAFFGLAVLLPVLARNGFGMLHTIRFPLHVLRATFQFSSMALFFFGLALVPLANATALSFTSPLFVTIFAALLLGERIRLRRVTAVFLGFVGMLVIIRPSAGTIEPGSLFVVASSATLAGMLITIKKLTATESSVAITTMGALILTVISLGPALWVWEWPTARQFALMFAMGGMGSLAHMITTQAMKHADASEVVPYDFTRLIWAVLLGFLIFSEVPTWSTIGGGLIIITSASYIAYRESQVGRQKRAEAKSAAEARNEPDA